MGFVIRWLISLGWDGVLPLVVLTIPLFARGLPPQKDAIQLGISILVPVTAALIRAAWAHSRLTAGRVQPPSIWRQVLFALAIIVLLLFEAVSGIMILMKADPADVWLVLLAMYAGYLVLLSAALGLFEPERRRAIP